VIDQSDGAGPRICVFGAGAVGGHVAARLARGGANVSLVARGDHLAAIRAGGLRVEAPDGVIDARVAASDNPRDLGPQDAVFVTVKTTALLSVAASIAPLLGPSTPIVFLMNGFPWWYFNELAGAQGRPPVPELDELATPWAEIGTDRAIGGVSYPACTVTKPGTIFVASQGKGIVLGEPDGEVSARVTMLAEVLGAGGAPVEVTSRIRDSIWTKLVNNLASGPLSILSQSAAKDLYEQPACLEGTDRCRAEAAAIARAMGCDVAAAAEAHAAGFRTLNHKSSIVQDLEHGRAMEIDSLYGIPLALARYLGVATPTLDLLVSLVKLRARAAGAYP
jgi:2-dehydropantoate 2-reductase